MEMRILCLQKKEQNYIFFYRPGREIEAITGLISFAGEPDLSVSWGDVHRVARELLSPKLGVRLNEKARQPDSQAAEWLI